MKCSENFLTDCEENNQERERVIIIIDNRFTARPHTSSIQINKIGASISIKTLKLFQGVTATTHIIFRRYLASFLYCHQGGISYLTARWWLQMRAGQAKNDIIYFML